MKLLQRVGSAAMLLALSTTLVGCAPGATTAVTIACDHKVHVVVEESASFLVERDFDLDVFKQSAHVQPLETGSHLELGLQPSNSSRTIMVIVYGADTAKVDYFGDNLTGSLEYTIAGDMCLLPTEEG